VIKEPQTILVVAHTLPLAQSLLAWLAEAGHGVAIVTTFSAAKAHLRTAPDLLITELRLREYNGLQLALRAHQDGIPTLVIGDPDPVLERDARQFGAAYLRRERIVRDDILPAVATMLAARPRRKGVSATDWDLLTTPRASAWPSDEPDTDLVWAVAPPDTRPPLASRGRTILH
jgi:DNA-binding NtrC family response regulator